MSPGGPRILAGRWWASTPALLPLAGFAALFATLGDSEAFLYRGGFLLTDGVTAAVIFVSVRMVTTRPSRIFALRPIVWWGCGRTRSTSGTGRCSCSRPQFDVDLPTLELLALSWRSRLPWRTFLTCL
jgi:hypothetical protein